MRNGLLGLLKTLGNGLENEHRQGYLMVQSVNTYIRTWIKTAKCIHMLFIHTVALYATHGLTFLILERSMSV